MANSPSNVGIVLGKFHSFAIFCTQPSIIYHFCDTYQSLHWQNKLVVCTPGVNVQVYTLIAHFTGFPRVLVTTYAYDSEVNKGESFLKSCLKERLEIFVYKRNAVSQLTNNITVATEQPLTGKNYWADNSYYSDLEVTIYGQ